MNNLERQSWMWAEACELVEQAERLHRQFFRLGSSARTWEPPVDVTEDGGQLVLTVALPGVSPEHVSLHLDDGGIVIEATRPPSVGTLTAIVRRLEIPYGRFLRRVSLPPGTYELQEQLFHHGCMSLRLLRRA